MNPLVVFAQNQLKAELTADIAKIRARHINPAYRAAATCAVLVFHLSQATGIPVNDLNEIVTRIYDL